MKHFLPILILSVLVTKSNGQRLPFENFNVDKGLSQSQVMGLAQDKEKHLWVGTYGGLNRFDGTSFRLFSKKDGINSNSISAVYTATNGTVWIATLKGLSNYDGYKFKNSGSKDRVGDFNFSTITESQEGIIYALETRGIYEVTNGLINKVPLPVADDSPTCLFKDRTGKLWVHFYKNGFYQLVKGKWFKKFSVNQFLEKESVRHMIEANGFFYVATGRGKIFKVHNDSVVLRQKISTDVISSMCLGPEGDIWLGAAKCILVLNANDLSIKRVINSANGLSDNSIIEIFRDIDGNMWLGSDGDGLYRYSQGRFSKFDRTNGIPGNLVMGFAKDKNDGIVVGIREGGLLAFSSSTKKFTKIDYSGYTNAGVNCLGNDRFNNIYVGTMDSRLLRIEGKKISEISLLKNWRPAIYSLVPYNQGIMALTTAGAFISTKDSVKKIEGLPQVLISAFSLNKDVILFGSSNGLFVSKRDRAPFKLNISSLSDISVNCINRVDDYIIVGSYDGLFFWDIRSNKVFSCNTENGLADNNVFGIFKDSKNNLWVGTSSGIQQVVFDKDAGVFRVKRFTISDGYENSETNLNAMMEDASGNIWIGTTKGAFIYNAAQNLKVTSKPYVVIKGIEFSGYTKDSTYSGSYLPWNQLPSNPRIDYRNNSISFTLKSIYYKNPNSVLYSYKLMGYDTKFSEPSPQSFLNYKNLEPGDYVLVVKAFNDDGVESENIARYPFTIITPYYKSNWFRMMVVAGLVLMGVMLQLFYSNMKRKKERELLYVKEQEQKRIREQTAEDFHDELGNKLTRISILTDVLQNKMNDNDEEKSKIIRQIKSNALALYTGTKEIVWSLSKESDNLKEVLKSIQLIGNELFNDTPIDFCFEGLDDISADIKMPTGYNRNIIMIFKELLNNSLRHSQCTQVIVEARAENHGTVSLFFNDNGKGFNLQNAPKGNGLSNITRRAERIGGTFTMNAIQGLGTSFKLMFHV